MAIGKKALTKLWLYFELFRELCIILQSAKLNDVKFKYKAVFRIVTAKQHFLFNVLLFFLFFLLFDMDCPLEGHIYIYIYVYGFSYCVLAL